MKDHPAVEIRDVTDEASFRRLPPCADARFDHRSCDYWEDPVRGSKAARQSWWRDPGATSTSPTAAPAEPDNPFAPRGTRGVHNPFSVEAISAALDPFAGDDLFATPEVNPFAPMRAAASADAARGPRKLLLLQRGRSVFGSYAKILFIDSEAAGYAQFGPLSAYPRARHLRDLYPRLPQSPLPAVITCIATTPEARGRGLARQLVEEVCTDLADRGFSAVEAYPDLTLDREGTSAAHPDFWRGCGFLVAVHDDRFPVMRKELG